MLYWLAVLKGKAHTLAEDTVVNTPTPSPRAISWSRRSGFRLEQRECEGKLCSYTLLDAERLWSCGGTPSPEDSPARDCCLWGGRARRLLLHLGPEDCRTLEHHPVNVNTERQT